ncbi:hypothetical protein BDF21DRAFT_394339 [Thamnidium elegans]|nr:hypothetical protein BDF21DRAFT_394339 [Thamnidium elegans]
MDSETENLFKRQRTGSAWKLRSPWEMDRLALMFQENESNHELHSKIVHPTASKRKRESTEPYIPSEHVPSQRPHDMMNDTNMVFVDPILYYSEKLSVTDVQPNLTGNIYSSDDLYRRNPFFNIQLALKHLIAQIELSIQLQETSINNQKITIQQLGQSIRQYERLIHQVR